MTHDYWDTWTYDVVITWSHIEWFGMKSTRQDNKDDWDKLVDIKQWWDVKLASNWKQFANCENIVSFSASDSPDLSNVTSLAYAFSYAKKFNWNLNNWDTSNVTNMLYMFYQASFFNQPLNNWNTSNVTNMYWIFRDASSFD
jgi:surface protein